VIALALYACFCLAFAWWNAVRIKKDLPIYHLAYAEKGLHNWELHITCWLIGTAVLCITKEWILIPAFPFVGRLFFDTALNLMRGLPLGYVSEHAKAKEYVEGSSKIDWREYHIFRSGITPKIVYLLIIISLIIIHYEY
jgi:hypothetical protein